MWFLTSADKKTAYIFINEENWKIGDRKDYTIQAFKASKKSQISVLGHNGLILEYEDEANITPTVKQTKEGMEISVTLSQRIYNDKKWKNPIVLKITELNRTE